VIVGPINSILLPAGASSLLLVLVASLLPFFWEIIGRKGRAGWISLMFLLSLAELVSINKDSAERQRQFVETLSQMKTLVSEATGADSYIYFSVQTPTGPFQTDLPGIRHGYIIANAIPMFEGKFPLHDVIVEQSCPDATPSTINYGTYYPREIGRPREMIVLQFPPTTPEKDAYCSISINASNGSYSQTVQFLKQRGQWTWGSRLTKYDEKGFRRDFAGAGFPIDYKWQ
jgi:hypothetical protein